MDLFDDAVFREGTGLKRLYIKKLPRIIKRKVLVSKYTGRKFILVTA